MKEKIEAFFKTLDKAAFVLAAICIGGMLFCVTLQVIARFTPLSANWTTELSQYFFLWSTTFASYVAARRGKLLGVELIQKKMPDPIQRLMKGISWGSAAFFYGLVLFYCTKNLGKLWRQSTPVLNWPMGMIYLIMLLGLLMLMLYCAYLAVLGVITSTKEQVVAEKTAEERAEEVE